MKHLLLSDLRLALPDLLDHKLDTLHSTHAGSLYAPRLDKQRAAIEALPERVFNDRRPLAEELAETDAEHDAYGAAIWHYTEALRLVPELADELRDAATQIRSTFIPNLSIINRSYASEAAHALGKREHLVDLDASLSLLPLPGGETLRAWVEAFIARGETLEALLRARAVRRASAVGEGPRKHAGILRSETIASLNRLRTALADELTDEPQTLAVMDAELFSYFDQLHDARISNLRPSPANTTPPATASASITSIPATGT